jgi:hypothetical protein
VKRAVCARRAELAGSWALNDAWSYGAAGLVAIGRLANHAAGRQNGTTSIAPTST